MERIKLSKREKQVLRILCQQGYDGLSEFDDAAVRSLDALGLVKGAYLESGGVEDAKLTTMGKEYLRGNPHLYNPVNWAMVSAIVAIVGSFGTIITIIVTCSS